MSLKRKASFPSLTSPNGMRMDPEVLDSAEQEPRHLHSRTRKRFRNDRPDDQTIYENTLRLLFSAQKEQRSSLEDEVMSLTPPPSDSESIDPRQQSLRKFFKPTQPSSSSMHIDCSSQKNHRSDSPFLANMVQSPSVGLDFHQGACTNGSMTPPSGDLDMDVEMDVSEPDQKRWVGGIGWI